MIFTANILLSSLLLILVSIIIVALILGEIFFIPGFGLLGILGGASFIGVGYYLFVYYSWPVLLLYLGICLLLFWVGFYFISRSKIIDKVALTKNIEGKVNQLPLVAQVGARAITTSRLTLGGMIRIGDTIFEAQSDNGFIEAHTPVIISRIAEDKVYVIEDQNTANI